MMANPCLFRKNLSIFEMGDVIVIGGGVAGMEAAGQLALHGCNVKLLEKDNKTGGNMANWYHLFPDRRDSREVLSYLNGLTENNNIQILTGTEATTVIPEGKKITVKTRDNNRMEADAVVIATGFELFNSRRKEEYGYGIYDNVITSADLEQMFRTGGVRLVDGTLPAKIGFIHCVGSRDEKVGNNYCSKLCCITAVKQAMEVSEKIPGIKAFSFYIDMRMGGAYYEELYKEAQEKYGVTFIRGKVSEISVDFKGKLLIKAEDTLSGRPLKMLFDMVVLMVGVEMPDAAVEIAKNSNLKCSENRFFQPADNHFGSNLSGINGVFYAGCCVAPMNITESISHARAAVNEVINYLKNNKQA